MIPMNCLFFLLLFFFFLFFTFVLWDQGAGVKTYQIIEQGPATRLSIPIRDIFGIYEGEVLSFLFFSDLTDRHILHKWRGIAPLF